MIISAIDGMFIFPQNSDVEILISKVMVCGDGPLEGN